MEEKINVIIWVQINIILLRGKFKNKCKTHRVIWKLLLNFMENCTVMSCFLRDHFSITRYYLSHTIFG